jgi:hypothetical protein
MLFVLVMKCFNSTINLAKVWGLLEALGPHIKYMTSLYADDMVLFISLVEHDLVVFT